MHWTQTPEGKERMQQIAAMGRAAQGLKPAGATAVKPAKVSKQGRRGPRTAAERKHLSRAMKLAWARRKREGTARKNGNINPNGEVSQHGIVEQVHSLAHGVADALLNGGLTSGELRALEGFGKFIEQHV